MSPARQRRLYAGLVAVMLLFILCMVIWQSGSSTVISQRAPGGTAQPKTNKTDSPAGSAVYKNNNPCTRTNSSQFSFPTVSDLLPHLCSLTGSSALDPPVILPNKQLPNVKLVLAIPAVERSNNISYLETTLTQLLDRAMPEHLHEMRIVVMLSHENGTESSWVNETVQDLSKRFELSIEQGTVQLIVLPPAFLPPNLHEMTPTLGDPKDRFYWRTKQSLDFLYLLTWASPQGEYFIQMEDDIEPSNNYTRKIMDAITKYHPWRELQFSNLGYIGKMIRRSEAAALALHIAINYSVKPIDWIGDNYWTNQLCHHAQTWKDCVKNLKALRRSVKPSIFQHVGVHSSLPGKIQKAKDRSFRLNPKR